MDTSSTDDGSVSCNRHDVRVLFTKVKRVEAREIEGEQNETRARSVLRPSYDDVEARDGEYRAEQGQYNRIAGKRLLEFA